MVNWVCKVDQGGQPGPERRKEKTMITHEATADWFTREEERAARMTTAELEWSILDALESAKLLAGHDVEAKYLDQVAVYARERRSRLSK